MTDSNHINTTMQHSEEYALDELDTVIGPSVRVEGDFSSEGNMIVKGGVMGSVNTSKLLTAEEGSIIVANVQSRDAIISGSVKGNINTHDQIEITSTAQILGDITCSVLVVEAGAQIKGKIIMKGVTLTKDDGAKKSSGARKTSKKSTMDGEAPLISEGL